MTIVIPRMRRTDYHVSSHFTDMEDVDMRVSTWILLAAAAALASGCGDDPAGPVSESWGSNRSTFEVTWKPDVIYFDSTRIGALRRIDTTRGRYYFTLGAELVDQLAVDGILVVHGVALRRITDVQTVGNEVAVETEYAPLTDAIADGTIAWDYGVDYRTARTPVMILSDGNRAVLAKRGADSFDITVILGSYSVTVGMRMFETRAFVSCAVDKSLGGAAHVRYAFEGNIERFRSIDSIVIAGGELKHFDHRNTNVKGDLTLSLAATASGSDALNTELPVTLLSIPFMVGAIPLTIDLKLQLVANAVVPVDGSSQVSVKFTYDSQTGFSYAGTDVQVHAQAGPYTIEKSIAQTGASGAVGINWGIGFPRLELSMFGEVLVPWVQTAFLIGGDFTFTPPCQQARAQFIGAVGFNFKLLGIDLLSGTRNLWQYEKVLLKTAECP